MIVTINLDTSNLSDAAVLERLFGSKAMKSDVTVTPTSVSTVTEPTETPAPAPKAAAKPKAPAKAAPAPEPTPEPVEDLISGVDFEALRKQVVGTATELVSTGQSQKVRDALAPLGAKRVGDLTDDQLEGFLAAIS